MSVLGTESGAIVATEGNVPIGVDASTTRTGMSLAYEITQTRNLLGEQDPNGNFSNAELTNHINVIRREISLAVRFPEIRLTGVAQPSSNTPGVEYQLSEDIIEIKRVYVAGQRLPETDIADLEGEGFHLYDMSGPLQQPQWQIAISTQYPFSADGCYPAEVETPYYPGRRGMFYRRGGNIGLVPPAAGGEQIIVEGVALAPDLVNLTDIDILPRYYITAISWGAAANAYFSDRNDTAFERCTTMYEKAKGDLRDQLMRFTKPPGLRILPYRLLHNVANISPRGFQTPWGSW